MAAYKDLSRDELLEMKNELETRFEDVKSKGLKLDMSRGKPSAAQLDLAMGMMDVLRSDSDLKCEEGVDCRNYGVLDGIREAKQLLADMISKYPFAQAEYELLINVYGENDETREIINYFNFPLS